jgi:hypothetical protein
MLAELENYFTSAQRILQYTKLDSEDDLTKPID